MIVAHLADLHLGYEAYERSERGRNARERDIAAAFQRAVHAIIRAAPDLILVVGDVFDRPDPPPGAFLALGRGLESLRVALPATTVLMAGGARDMGPSFGQPGPLSAMDAFPNVESADGTARSVIIGSLDARALLVPYSVLREPPMPPIHPDPDMRWNVLALPAVPAASGPEIRLSDWDYVALGSRHGSAQYGPMAHDPGSLERLDPDPWAGIDEPKGFLLADLEAGTVERREVSGRPTIALAGVRLDRLSKGARPEDKLREVVGEVPGGIADRLVRMPVSGASAEARSGLEEGLLGELRATALHIDVRPSSGVTPAASAHPPHEAASQVDLGSVHWPEGFRLLPPPPKPPEGFVCVVSRGGAALGRALRRWEAGGGIDHAEAGDPTDRDPAPLRMGWWGGGGADPVELASECARALAELAGVQAIGEELRLLGFPLPVESSDRAEADIEGVEAELAALRERIESVDPVEVELQEAEEEEQRIRGEVAEADGDAESAVMDWLRERQDAETTLNAYRDRARELAKRLRELEERGEDAECPTCGRALGARYEQALTLLREEYDGLVQDGKWWRRRWDQLAEKAPEVQRRESAVVRLQAELEEAGERLHRARLRLREEDELRARELVLRRRRAFLLAGGDAATEPDPASDEVLARGLELRGGWLAAMSEARGRLGARAGEYLVEITAGRYPGFVETATGALTPIGIRERAGRALADPAAELSLQLAFAEMVALAAADRVSISGMLLAGAIDALPSDAQVRAASLLKRVTAEHHPIVIVIGPRAFGGTRECFDRAVELAADGSTQRLAAGAAGVRIASP